MFPPAILLRPGITVEPPHEVETMLTVVIFEISAYQLVTHRILQFGIPTAFAFDDYSH